MCTGAQVAFFFSPFEVFFLLCETCPGQSGGGLAQIAHKIIAEVERHGAFVRQQPPNAAGFGKGAGCGGGHTPVESRACVRTKKVPPHEIGTRTLPKRL